jgi:hypothetical protein
MSDLRKRSNHRGADFFGLATPYPTSRGQIFGPAKHSFNPLKDIDYKRARDLAKDMGRDYIYTLVSTPAPHQLVCDQSPPIIPKQSE